ncbi:diaminobutyrate acetyltransferase [Streptomyces hygroscopicus]|uniref:diaminobutyrate acetyltransferase n=1 Tax=Streptomyces hygroscopicus TaxID=1912 RepID=UPI001FCC24D4|nr:diaminobutyrate acetyltransferase [Streptomyces hygroscopicus]
MSIEHTLQAPSLNSTDSANGHRSKNVIHLDAPRADEGPSLWNLAREARTLDVNSPYFYALWCRDFSASSVVARSTEGIHGFTLAFARPKAPETLFVWQTAVSAALQGQGLARRMVDHLANHRFRFVEATVTPDNTASDRFLSAFARARGARLERKLLFGAELFPAGHSPEELLRIGPLNPPQTCES